MTPPLDKTAPEVDPVLAAFDRAPRGEPLSAEQHEKSVRRSEDLLAGRAQGVPSDEVRAKIEAMRREQGG